MTCDLLLLGQKLVLRNDSPRTQKSPKSSAPSEAWLIRCCSRAFRTCLITPSHSRVVSMKLCSRVVSMKLSFRLPSPSTDLRKSSSQVDLDYSSPIRSRKQERALSSSSSIELGGGAGIPPSLWNTTRETKECTQENSSRKPISACGQESGCKLCLL